MVECLLWAVFVIQFVKFYLLESIAKLLKNVFTSKFGKDFDMYTQVSLGEKLLKSNSVIEFFDGE